MSSKRKRARMERLLGEAFDHLSPLTGAIMGGCPDAQKVIGATLVLRIKDKNGEGFMEARTLGCTCPGCLRVAVEAVAEAFGARAVQVAAPPAAQVH